MSTTLLAIDDHGFPWHFGVYLEMCEPAKRADNPILPRRENGKVDAWRLSCPSVVRVGNRWHMWYVARHQPYGNEHIHIAYACSDDGITWHRPALGLVNFAGSRENNLVDVAPGLNTCSVIHDPNAPDDQRFLMVGEDMTAYRKWGFGQPSVTRIDASADGLTWRTLVSPDAFAQIWEPSSIYKFNNLYHIGGHTNGTMIRLPLQSHELGGYLGPRTFVIARSPSLQHWPGELHKAFHKPMRSSSPDHPGWDREEVHLGAHVHVFGDYCLGMCGLYHHPVNPGDPVYDGRQVSVDLGLLISNDGLHFREPAPGFVFMARDQELAWDRDWPGNTTRDNLMLLQGTLVNRDDLTLCFYAATTPGGNVHEVASNIGLATLPRDRFGCLKLHPKASVGTVRTRPLHFDQPVNLSVNAHVPEGGMLTLELCDEHGLTCRQLGAVTGSGLDLRMKPDATLPVSQAFSLRARMTGATQLFALNFTD